jgi:hypothetical protein
MNGYRRGLVSFFPMKYFLPSNHPGSISGVTGRFGILDLHNGTRFSRFNSSCMYACMCVYCSVFVSS